MKHEEKISETDLYTLKFSDGSEKDFDRLGGKCTSLAVLINAELNVPPGFAVTTDAYHSILMGGLGERIQSIIETINVQDVNDLDEKSEKIRNLIIQTELPSNVERSIRESYREFCKTYGENTPVAVRSSATAEDLPDASFAGQQDTYLWIVNEEDVLNKIKLCWASLFNSRAIAYRNENNIGHIDVLMSVGIQKMVNAKAAGVAMTLDPLNGDRSKIVLDSSWGIGEMVVSGEVTPDNFTLDKILLEIIKRNVSVKGKEMIADQDAKSIRVQDIPEDRQSEPSLTDKEIILIAELAKKAEKLYGSPQDIEWAVDHDLPAPDNIVLLQSRPETVWSQKPQQKETKTVTTGIEGVVGTLLNPMKLS